MKVIRPRVWSVRVFAEKKKKKRVGKKTPKEA